MRMHWGHGLAWTMVGWLAGCGPLIILEGSTETDAEDGGTTDPPPPGTTTAPPSTTTSPGTTTTPPNTTTPPPSDSTSGGPTMTSAVFLDGLDFWEPFECDFFQQDCPFGEKCMPWANDGGSQWNALRCSPIVDDPDGVGEACTAEGSGLSGIDSCELGSMCWDVDPVTLEGECVAFCVGSEAAPTCEDPDSSCAISGDSVLALCFPNCNPLAQDCDAGDACYPINDGFQCAPDASGEVGAPGDECEFINVCDPGSACLPIEHVPGCAGLAGCCSSFCDLTMEPAPCLPGQECLPWYEEGQAPPKYENVGICGVAM